MMFSEFQQKMILSLSMGAMLMELGLLSFLACVQIRFRGNKVSSTEDHQ